MWVLMYCDYIDKTSHQPYITAHMNRRNTMGVIGTATIMRHGPTRYTGIFPDLAEEGLAMIRTTAEEIATRFPKELIVIASPAQRAIATALQVMEICGLEPAPEVVRIESMLRPIKLHDLALATGYFTTVLDGLADVMERHRRWDEFYMTSHDYEVGVICESRSSAMERFDCFLTNLREICANDRHVIAVTHLEVVGTAVHRKEWFGCAGGECYFRPAEAVHIIFMEDRTIRVEFRGVIKEMKF
jgi:broad specificity phosphatase PhoE